MLFPANINLQQEIINERGRGVLYVMVEFFYEVCEYAVLWLLCILSLHKIDDVEWLKTYLL